MSRRSLIDTNVVVRHLVGDHAAHSEAAGKLFGVSDRGAMTLVLLPSVLSECVFVLESFYDYPRKRIADALRQLIQSPGVELADAEIHVDALDQYAVSKLHFVDCALAAYAKARSWPVATFDADFGKLVQVTWLNPSSL
jgi:predicted nucleic acid-binding protein